MPGSKYRQGDDQMHGTSDPFSFQNSTRGERGKEGGRGEKRLLAVRHDLVFLTRILHFGRLYLLITIFSKGKKKEGRGGREKATHPGNGRGLFDGCACGGEGGGGGGKGGGKEEGKRGGGKKKVERNAKRNTGNKLVRLGAKHSNLP